MILFLGRTIVLRGKAGGALRCLYEFRQVLVLLQGVTKINLRRLHHQGVGSLSHKARSLKQERAGIVIAI